MALAQASLVNELIRKAEASEPENGFCRRVEWSNIDYGAYVHWLESASLGTSKANKFANGNCQHDEVTRVSQQNGRKCVHYTFYVWASEGGCNTGNSVACKQPNGDWKR